MLFRSGGSARAVVAALAELELAAIQIAGRRPEALAALLADCSGWSTGIDGLDWSGRPGDLAAPLTSADLVVNTTPVGMASAQDAAAAERCPLAEADLEALGPGTVVYDLITTPRPTRLLERAAALGCPVIDGLEMLVGQGAAALRLWTGSAEVPVAAMRRAALAQLEGA